MIQKVTHKKGEIRISTKIKKQAMLKALDKTMSIVSMASKLAGISRRTHYRWLKEDKEYKNAVIELKECALDFAEASLLEQIRKGNTTATIFYLKTKGKHRGYVETTFVKPNYEPQNDFKNMTNEELLKIINS